jgi:hypothetical protein
VTREQLEALRKNWDFDRVLKGRGFSRKCSEISGGFRRWEKLRLSKRLFSQPLGVATIRVMATVVEMVISFSGDRNSSGVFRLRSAGASLRSR